MESKIIAKETKVLEAPILGNLGAIAREKRGVRKGKKNALKVHSLKQREDLADIPANVNSCIEGN